MSIMGSVLKGLSIFVSDEHSHDVEPSCYCFRGYALSNTFQKSK